MRTVRFGDTIWLTRGGRSDAGERKAAGGAMAARLLGLAALAAGAFAAGASVLPPSDPAGVPFRARAVSAKDETRLPAWTGPLGPGAEALAPAAQDRPPAARAGAEGPDGWREAEFTQVAVLDGRTLDAAGLRIRLEGIALPDPGEVCRTLDGRLESCLTRAATQLELTTRWRRVACRYRLETASEAVGACRIGAADLAERLVKTGFAHRPAQAARAAAAQVARLD